jgi:hypothetical protein
LLTSPPTTTQSRGRLIEQTESKRICTTTSARHEQLQIDFNGEQRGKQTRGEDT